MDEIHVFHSRQSARKITNTASHYFISSRYKACYIMQSMLAAISLFIRYGNMIFHNTMTFSRSAPFSCTSKALILITVPCQFVSAYSVTSSKSLGCKYNYCRSYAGALIIFIYRLIDWDYRRQLLIAKYSGRFDCKHMMPLRLRGA